MDVVLLGTGSADGWPNPFCTCASCNTAREHQQIRGQTSALVDDRLLIDCGPESPRAASRLNVRLDAVEVMLFTHAHPDHVGPAALLFRNWAHRRQPLTVIGPPAVIEMCRPWVGPDDRVTFETVAAGDCLDVAGFRVRALVANHEGPEVGPAVLYDVLAPDRGRLLYAADTGPLPASTLRDVADAGFDLALIEETFGDITTHGTDHLDLVSFGTTVARLRDVGALTSTSQVVAVHLSHHNPPTPQLTSRLAEWGVQVLPDGARLTTPAPGTPRVRSSLPLPHRTLVLGGARSGKSSYAEGVLGAHPRVTYVATAPVRVDDSEWEQRIAHHRSRRPSHWTTLETGDVAGVLSAASADDVLLIDCLTLWLTRMLDETGAWEGSTDTAMKRVDELLHAWATTSARVVAVSNEVGWGVVPATAAGRLFRDLQGQLNARLAAASEQSVLLVAGRAVAL
ncbi:MAG TPA: bifunctional adenosylcobinamide kinase/adenosylcobinamide-phosphate guanylyltransferase [Actinomycetes bacterium]|nr:bifunctional adenosylcobinamide kinase/adenosylcobinamide-phosphate guanylyltransferase [Actinomycetes bacterium]